MDKIIIGAGLGLASLGVGFLVASPMMLEVREPFILGGLLWSIIGGITIMIGRSKGSKKRRELGALR